MGPHSSGGWGCRPGWSGTPSFPELGHGKDPTVLWFIIALIVGGLIVGALGRLVHPGPDPMGIGMTILIGIAANLIVGLLLHGTLGGLLSFILAVIVASVFVALWSRRTAQGRHMRPFA
jgi:uncharacterized membrane protein YeaQ/YmgE (transglycosylase-associated protein family)